MVRFFFVTVLAAVFFNSQAQQAPIAIVSSNGTTRLTSTLDSAASLADPNDIIYLPGGTFAGMSTYFTKKVTVIGVGHNPDSTSATGRTYINGNIGFYTGAEGSVLDGVYVFGRTYVATDVKIYRTNTALLLTSCGWPDAHNITVDKCVIREGIFGGEGAYQFCGASYIRNSTVKNSVIAGNFTQYHENTIFENNVFLNEGAYGIEQALQCTFRNNTFTGITSWGSSASNSFFYNNIFAASTLPALTNNGNASSNVISQDGAATFVTPPSSNYEYLNDYIIKATSLGHNGGTDGKDVGIYGGASPWIKGNIPPNPHIRIKNVDAATGAGGTLRVRFNVSVQ